MECDVGSCGIGGGSNGVGHGLEGIAATHHGAQHKGEHGAQGQSNRQKPHLRVRNRAIVVPDVINHEVRL